jgi:beta-phosphoglucomutase-like phosphatase (HAD superfamily)
MQDLMESEGIGLRPGAREWLAFVIELGIPLGLATSSGPVAVRERLGELLPLFAAIATRADVEHGKPHPDLYLEAAARLGIEPGMALAVEDSPAGTQAALAAGMPVVVVPDLIAPPDDLAAHVVGVFPSLDALRETATRHWVPTLRRSPEDRAPAPPS